jgi:uncharacterized membrane protein (DUF373 family)
VHHLSRRLLEPAQDLIIVGIAIALFALTARALVDLFVHAAAPALDFRSVISEVLFMLVMVELVRLLIIYLEEHRIAVDVTVELGVVSTLREVVLTGVTELQWQQVAAISVFLLVLTALLRLGELRGPKVMDD